MTEAPFPWWGGKRWLAPKIVELMPPHDTYVEVFGGSGAVLFYKTPAELEVYNDINGSLVNFMRVLRERPEDLQQALTLTPYARDELEACRSDDGADDLERARRFYVRVYGSFGGQEGAGWSFNVEARVKVDAFANAVDRLHTCAQRLRRVQVDSLDWRDCLKTYDRSTTCFYLDPPYVLDTRTGGKAYLHEMTDRDHRDFVVACAELKGDAVISGYEHPIYEPLVEAGYELHRIDTVARVRSAQAVPRTECIWRRTSHSDTLFPLYAVDVAPPMFSEGGKSS